MHFEDYNQVALQRGWFDPCFYLDLLQSEGISIRATDLSLFEHYATVGWKRGLSPSQRFSVDDYLARYTDVAASQVDPLYHYLVRGRWEKRQAFALFEPPDGVQFVGLAECHGIEAQLALAQAQGISAFCLPYEASRGDGVLDKLGPATPFCLVLDHRSRAHRGAQGEGGETALEAQYGLIHDVLEILADPRHILVCGKPLLVVCRPEFLENPPLTLELWRQVARRAGLGGLFMAGMTFLGGSGEGFGLDARICEPQTRDWRCATPVFPGFMPDRDLTRWRGSKGNAPEVFRAWLATTAAEQTQDLAERGLPQLVFVDWRNGWAGGAQALVGAAGPAPADGKEHTSKLRRFAEAILVSSRLPVVFLYQAGEGGGQAVMQRLIASLAQVGGLECFVLVDGEGEAGEPHALSSALSLRELDVAGWSREQKVEALAQLLRARGDLVVVSWSLATAGLLALFATQGHRLVSFVHELPAALEPAASTIARVARCAQRIIVSHHALRNRIVADCAIASADIQVLQPPDDRAPSEGWRRYVEDVRHCLLGLGNEGRRIRLGGGTVGRQDIAGDLCVVVPSYNHKTFLLAALDSILAQSVRPGEIRIIDDGSNDGSADLVRSLASDELGIFVKARQNRGGPATINEAVAATQCPIVAVMNSDDRWHPLRIEELIGDLRRHDGADVVFSRLRFLASPGRSEDKRTWYERGVADYRNATPMWLALMFCNFFFTTSNLIAKREKFLDVGGFGPLRYCHDLDYMLKAIFAGQQVHFVEQTLCEYRVHDSNTIDEDVNKVLFEEAWIVVKFLRQNFGQFSETERQDVAQRICGKNLAGRVLSLLRVARRHAAAMDDERMYTDSRFSDILRAGHQHGGDTVEPAQLEREMAQLLSARVHG